MKPMLATFYDKSRVVFPCLAQPKYDGVRCIICLIGDEVHLLSRNGKEYNVPHLKEWAERHRSLLPLDGEIYNHGELTFQQICSAVKCYSSLTKKLKFVVYDRPCNYTMINRWIVLVNQFKNLEEPVFLSGWYCLSNASEVDWYHDKCVSEGFEGCIIRNPNGKYIEGRSGDLMKLKKFDTTEFEIVDVIEAAGKDKGTALFVLKSGEFTFSSRPIGSIELRSCYLKDKAVLIGKMCTVQHQGFTDNGSVPRFPVAICVRDYE